jgi:hypothetical protein
MRKFVIVALLAALGGCSSPSLREEAGIGIIPLNGATLTGQVVETSEPAGVLLKTASDRSFLLPEDWEYRSEGQTVPLQELQPGTTVTAATGPSGGR